MSVNCSGFTYEMLSGSLLQNDIKLPLINALKLIASKMNFSIPFTNVENLSLIDLDNFDDYALRLGLILCKSNITSFQELRFSTFPVLVQEDETNKLYVLLKLRRSKAYLYDPLNEMYVNKNVSTLKVTTVWQCYPISPIHQSGFYALLKFIFTYFYKTSLLVLILGGFSGLSGLLISVLSGYIFSHPYEIGQVGYIPLFYTFFFLFLGVGLLGYLSDMYTKIINFKIKCFIIPSIMSSLMHIPLKTMNQYMSGEVHQWLSDYEIAISEIITNLFSMIYTSMVLLIFLFYLAYCNSLLAFIYLLICSFSLMSKIIFFYKNVIPSSNALKQKGKITALLNEIFLQIHKIRSGNAERKVFQRWLDATIKSKAYSEQTIKTEIHLFLLEALIPIILLLFLYYKVYTSINVPSASLILQFMVCASQSFSVLDRLSSNVKSIIHLLPNLSRIKPLLRSVYINQASDDLFVFNSCIKLDHVSFHTENSAHLILKNISMQINPGQFIAIIGESGSGKSTLLKLLLGLELATAGQILFDNKNIKDINLYQIRKEFGVVLQTTSIFAGTIFSNMTINTSLTTDDAWKLLKCVGLYDDVQAMPMKLHTYLSDNATESISGGQRQKLLIARALATKPKILVLDEATSALDANSQEYIYKNLTSLGITKIVVAHRLSTIRNADMIYVLHKGKILCQGTYNELNEKGII